MATPRKSRLDESLVDMVTDETDVHARAAGHSLAAGDSEALAAEREDKIQLYVSTYLVPRKVAELMADTGYSKGTANRILLDRAKRASRLRDAKASAA